MYNELYGIELSRKYSSLERMDMEWDYLNRFYRPLARIKSTYFTGSGHKLTVF